MFFSQFWRAPRSVGALLPSSEGLSAAMVAAIDFNSLSTILEFGPGTGIMTADIATRLQPGQRYLGIEINKAFYDTLTARFPELTFVNKSAVDLDYILRSAQIQKIDAVLCALPWASLPINDQEKILS